MEHDLRPEDFQSAAWKRLAQAIGGELARLRKANDNPALGEVKTSHLRGQIAAMNKILDLASASSGSEVGPRTWEEALAFPGIGDRQPVDH